MNVTRDNRRSILCILFLILILSISYAVDFEKINKLYDRMTFKRLEFEKNGSEESYREYIKLKDLFLKESRLIGMELSRRKELLEKFISMFASLTYIEKMKYYKVVDEILNELISESTKIGISPKMKDIYKKELLSMAKECNSIMFGELKSERKRFERNLLKSFNADIKEKLKIHKPVISFGEIRDETLSTFSLAPLFENALQIFLQKSNRFILDTGFTYLQNFPLPADMNNYYRLDGRILTCDFTVRDNFSRHRDEKGNYYRLYIDTDVDLYLRIRITLKDLSTGRIVLNRIFSDMESDKIYRFPSRYRIFESDSYLPFSYGTVTGSGLFLNRSSANMIVRAVKSIINNRKYGIIRYIKEIFPVSGEFIGYDRENRDFGYINIGQQQGIDYKDRLVVLSSSGKEIAVLRVRKIFQQKAKVRIHPLKDNPLPLLTPGLKVVTRGW